MLSDLRNAITTRPAGRPLPPPVGALAARYGPRAIGLIITGLLALVLTPAALAACWDPNFLKFEGGLLMPLVVAVAVVAGLLMLTGAPLLLIAGVQMLRLRGRGWALLAAVVALLPWSPTRPPGVAVGPWAPLVLLRADVRAAFR